MNPYSNKCPHCNSPARRNRNVLICSNVKCKSWKLLRKLSAKLDYSRIKYGKGLTSDDPIVIRCPSCNNIGYRCNEGEKHYAGCDHCEKIGLNYQFSYTYKIDHWYYSVSAWKRIFITKHIDTPKCWDYDSQIHKKIED